MKLIDALKIVHAPTPGNIRPLAISLVCGFNPLHLQTFLAAQLRMQIPQRQPKIHSGLYGDFWGNLMVAKETNPQGGAVLLEWPDLDPRLGIRNLGAWAPSVLDEIIESATSRCNQLEAEVRVLASKSLVAISFPTLPLPPIATAAGWRASSFELTLRAKLADLSVRLAAIDNVRILNQQRLDEISPAGGRLDVTSEIVAGFPYRLTHASALAVLFSRLLAVETPKKGLITDLDDTLWRGLLGEVGSQGVSWDLEHQSHMHGAYQNFLRSLAEAGVFLGVASKNEVSLVGEVFQRQDLILPQDSIFPMDVSWGPKSSAVARISKSWNIGLDSIVFVDDSPAELAEVKSAHPEVECLLFPTSEPQAVFELLRRLRDLFGKEAISAEDRIRAQSMRWAPEFTSDKRALADSPDGFLRQAKAELTLDFTKEPLDSRALELITKTNQFNLNGRRYHASEWLNYVNDPKVFLLLASYRDKYGPLGKIAVVTGRMQGSELRIENWVMSCRAFSRRIEYACLERLYGKFQTDRIQFDFVSTERNAPMRAFLEEIFRRVPAPDAALSRDDFLRNRRQTFHLVEEVSHA